MLFALKKRGEKRTTCSYDLDKLCCCIRLVFNQTAGKSCKLDNERVPLQRLDSRSSRADPLESRCWKSKMAHPGTNDNQSDFGHWQPRQLNAPSCPTGRPTYDLASVRTLVKTLFAFSPSWRFFTAPPPLFFSLKFTLAVAGLAT